MINKFDFLFEKGAIAQSVMWASSPLPVTCYFLTDVGEQVGNTSFVLSASPTSLLGLFRAAIGSDTAQLPSLCVALQASGAINLNFSAPAGAEAVGSSVATHTLPVGKNRLGGGPVQREAYNLIENSPRFVTLSVSSSGSTELVAAVPGCRIRVLAYNMIAAGSTNVKFRSASTDITGLKYLAANTGIVANYSEAGWFQTAAGEALNINLSASQAVGGEIVYQEVQV